MTELADVRTALKTVLEAALSGVTVYDKVPGQVNVPAIVVEPADANFDVAFGRGADTWEIDLTMVVALADDQLAQSKLDPYVTGGGSSSVRKAIFSNRSLSLSDCDAHISGMTGYGARYVFGANTYIGAVFRLVAHIKPTT